MNKKDLKIIVRTIYSASMLIISAIYFINNNIIAYWFFIICAIILGNWVYKELNNK